MPIERILISPDIIRLKDSDGNTSFSTEFKYIKTDVNGSFRVGGNFRTPVIAGQDPTIQDQTNLGGYLVAYLTRSIYGLTTTPISVLCPSFDSLQLLVSDDLYSNAEQGRVINTATTTAPVYYNGAQIATVTYGADNVELSSAAFIYVWKVRRVTFSAINYALTNVSGILSFASFADSSLSWSRTKTNDGTFWPGRPTYNSNFNFLGMTISVVTNATTTLALAGTP